MPGSPIHTTDAQITALCARDHDWTSHPLGAPHTWPIELRTILSVLFNTRQPMCLFWGERHWYFYNDGYIPILSEAKHPWAMGRAGEEVWAEAWPLLIPQIEQVRAEGRATWNVDHLVPVLKNGALQNCYFTYSYSPVFLADGTVGGTLVTCSETTARVRAERDLRSKMEALEHSLNGFDIVDDEGRFVYANRAYLAMWGYDSLEEMLGTSPADHCADPETPRRIIGALKEKGECELEFVARRRDGSLFDVHMWARLAHDAEGREIYPTTSIDITNVKRVERQLRESEERLRLALEAASMGVYERDLTTGGVSWSDQARKILGHAEGKLEESFEAFIARMHPEDRERFHREAVAAAREGRSVDIAYRFERPDGQVRWLHAYGQGLKDDDGHVSRAIGVLQDVTERMLIEEKLRQSEARFREIADSMPQIVWTADARGHTDFLNARWFEYTGAPRTGDEPWKTFVSAEYIHPDDAARAAEAWARAFEQQRQFEAELRLRRHTGEYRWHMSRCVPIVDSQGRVGTWCGTTTDVDAQIKANAELERAVRARDEFLSIASHELKTPLTALSLQTQSAKRALRRAEDGQRAIERLSALVQQTERQTDRLVRLVEDMLDVARIETGRLTLVRSQVDLCELVSDTVQRLRPQFEASGTELVVSMCSPLLVEIDRDRIEQVVLNLLTNALRYGRRRPVQVEVDREGDLARCAVRDQGMGIAPEHQRRVFDRFERAVPASDISGLGLGLYISRQIVESHGGSIKLESTLGVGSAFVVELPIASAPAPA